MDFDLIIKNGTVIDGTGMAGQNLDIGIRQDTITLLDPYIPDNGCPTVYAKGMIVAPGFVDIHSHSDFLWLVRPESDSKILDGVTTEICGNCGLSAFPLRGKMLERRTQGLAKYGIVPAWQSAAEFYEVAEKGKSSINRAFLVGHGNIRACVIEYENRRPDPYELVYMKKDLEEAMQSGAFGMSSGLIYPPGCYATTGEITEMCRVIEKYGGFYTTHIRNEGDLLEDALTEAIEVSKRSGVRLQVSHLKTSGNRNWHKIEDIKTIIEHAIGEGIDVTCDRYPYIAAATDLDVVLPNWVYEGGAEKQIQRLKDANTRKHIAKEVSREYDDTFWNGLMISSVCYDKNKWMEGKTISEIAKDLNKPPLETIFDLLIDEDTRVDIFLFSMCEENLERILLWDFVFIGSDSSLRAREGILSEGKPHPRSYGTFSRVLGRFCREEKVLSVEKAIQKMTGLPAQKVGLARRGLIREGYFADITIFHPEKITDKSTFTEPHQYSEGIEYVIVNGKITVSNGRHNGTTNGRILRKI
ncbi:MAG: D-aminoacylase [Candidatus Brocadia sp. AMX2]|uniref:N-acyl-D-amino-acid deacylase n=1 Tax=Candidatus Brocadia sinica JPN1 TaxID=1197129 RepID=A0ABQ0JYT7_9BACT|nr:MULTISPECIES: D-aminoacylase [Brocadia]KXK29944.1 MAG: N-acyl-D-amino-acid deacylase [Candidatus Brocadia sinica]MBC6931389.1 D-aminoacylase [Candidatus Brocadia sp.]MBL1167555.1 D-aminoacylase [Candidatus Brocadia sp. AMX1]NOG40553.1 D-aminoacylase [Planctomycetota bacterium]KAA0244120.1 MAG: D-aminoacylase [Candidatus Brocadia sp. AMX2]